MPSGPDEREEDAKATHAAALAALRSATALRWSKAIALLALVALVFGLVVETWLAPHRRTLLDRLLGQHPQALEERVEELSRSARRSQEWLWTINTTDRRLIELEYEADSVRQEVLKQKLLHQVAFWIERTRPAPEEAPIELAEAMELTAIRVQWTTFDSAGRVLDFQEREFEPVELDVPQEIVTAVHDVIGRVELCCESLDQQGRRLDRRILTVRRNGSEWDPPKPTARLRRSQQADAERETVVFTWAR